MQNTAVSTKVPNTRQKQAPAATVAPGDSFTRRHWRELLVAAALVALTWVAFAPVVHNGFINLDDGDYIYENPVVQSGLNWLSLQWALTSTKVSGYPHPLTWITHMLDYELHGLDAGGHHLGNVLLHIVNALLVFLLLRAMTAAVWRSALVAVLFAVHPLRVESVAWASERKDVLAGTFYLLGLLCYGHYVRRPESRRRYLLVALSFALGLLSKPTVLSFPLLLLVLDYWPLRRWQSAADTRRLVVEKAPLLAMTLVWGVISYLGQVGEGATKELAGIPLWERILNAIYSYAMYLRDTIWPAKLAPIYAYKSTIPWGGVAVASIVLAVISIAVIRHRGARPWGLAGWLWYAGVLAPMAGVIQYGLSARADRNTYLPSIGLWIVLVWALHEVLPRRLRDARILAAAAMAVIAPLVWASRRQCALWKDDLTLFGHNVAVESDNKFAIANLGLAWYKAGDYQKALQLSEQALKLDPRTTVLYERMAMSHFKLGHLQEALKNMDVVMQRHPRYADGHFNRGIILFKMGRHEEAVEAYRKAIASGLRPERAAVAHNDIGVMLTGQKRYQEAVKEYEASLRADERYLQARRNIAIALLYLGRRQEALEHLAHYLMTRPGDLQVQELVQFIKSGKDPSEVGGKEEQR